MDWLKGIESETIIAVIGSLVTGIFGFVGAVLTLRSQAAKEASVAADALRDDMMGWVDHQAVEIRAVRKEIEEERERARQERSRARREHEECLERERKLRIKVELDEQQMNALKERVTQLERRTSNGSGQ